MATTETQAATTQENASAFVVDSEVQSLLDDIWTRPETQSRFLHRPHALLDGKTPLECLSTKNGRKKVIHILAAIIHGLPV